MKADRDIQVLIVGAGIGGLTLAGFLHKAGLNPVVVEREESIDGPRGPIPLWPECTDLLTALEIWDDVCSDGTAVTTWSRRRPDGTVASRLRTDTAFGVVAIEYTQLRARLFETVSSDTVQTGMALQSFDTDRRGITVEFKNGVREQFDIVVGADGVHSRTREHLTDDIPSFCGTTSVTFPLDVECNLGSAEITDTWTAGGTVFRTVLGSDQTIGWLTLPTNVPEQRWRDVTVLGDLCPAIDWVLPDVEATLSSDDVWRIDDFAFESNRWADGRIALLGDAAHGHHRVAGVGTLLAIEDAAALATALLNSSESLSDRLVEYATRRQSRHSHLPQAEISTIPLNDIETDPLADLSVPTLRGSRLATCFEGTRPEPTVTPPDPLGVL